MPTKRYCQTLSLKDSCRNTVGRHSGNGNVYLWNAGVYDCRNPFGFRLEYGDGRAFSFATSAGMGRLCSSFPKVRAGKHIIPKMGTDGTDVLSV